MYIVDSDSILCKRDLFLKKSLFSIVRFYEVQKCWVYNMLLSIFDVCCTHKVRIKVEKERKVAIGLNVFNEIPVLLMNTMIKPWKNLLYYGEIENQFLIEDTFFYAVRGLVFQEQIN